MSATSDFAHLSRATRGMLAQAKQYNAEAAEQLQTSGSTIFVNALRTATMELTLIAVGAVGTFEALLQAEYKWPDAFKALDAFLTDKGHLDLVERFRDYRDAINVLKHGEGRSYDRLLARKAVLAFDVKDRGIPFFHEGDVSEVSRLVAANAPFVEQCVDTIDEIVGILEVSLQPAWMSS